MELADLLNQLDLHTIIAIDFETTALDPSNDTDASFIEDPPIVICLDENQRPVATTETVSFEWSLDGDMQHDVLESTFAVKDNLDKDIPEESTVADDSANQDCFEERFQRDGT